MPFRALQPAASSTGSTPGFRPLTDPHADPYGFMKSQTEEPEKGFGSKVGGFVKSVGNILTGNTQKFGNTIGSTLALPEQQKSLEESNAGKFDQQQKLIKAIRDNKSQGKDTKSLEKVYKDLTGSVPTIEELNPTINKSTGQVLGEALGTGVEALSVGSLKGVKGVGLIPEIAKTAKEAEKAKQAFSALSTGEKLLQVGKTALKEGASLAPIGYGFDVSENLQEGKTGASAFKPGLGTAGAVVLPAAFNVPKLLGVLGKAEAPRVINSLIKPLLKDFSYGKNPGRTISELGITANSLDELGTNIKTARDEIGRTIGSVSKFLSTGSKKVLVDTKSTILDSIDQAMQKAAKNNDSTVLNRLQDVKKALTKDLVKRNVKGIPSIVAEGTAKLNKLTYEEALKLKSRIGDLTKFTGNASDDKAVNSTLKSIYGQIKDAMNSAAKKANPEIGKKLERLNEQYGDLISGEVATKYRDKIASRQNLIGMSPTIAGLGGALATAIGTGGAAIPTLLVGASAAALDKAFASTAFKTRVASWLARESPSVIERLLNANPALRKGLSKLIDEEKTPIGDAIKGLFKKSK